MTRGYRQAFPAREFVLEGPDGSVPVWADPNRIYQMLDKLVENAVDFSPERSRIVISLKRYRKEAKLSVMNEGPPLAPGMMEHIFDSMVSLRDSPGHSGHMGLGLYVVSTIARFHGGHAAARNRDDGVPGTVFTVTLPLYC